MSTTGCCRGLSAKDCIARPHGCSDGRPAQALDADNIESKLRRAAGLNPKPDDVSISRSRGFLAGLGCGARVEISHIDGKFVGSVGLHLRRLTPEAAEAVLNLLRTRNEANSIYDR